jgi:hypothetical protein
MLLPAFDVVWARHQASDATPVGEDRRCSHDPGRVEGASHNPAWGGVHFDRFSRILDP